MIKKKILMILISALMLFTMSGCSESDNETSSQKSSDNQKNEITVTTSGGYYPYAFQDEGKLKGMEAEIWEEFEKRTGIKVNWTFTDFSGLLGLVQSGKADAVSAQLSATEERKQNFIFSDSYMFANQNIIVKSDNDGIKTIEDLKGKKVGIGTGNIAAELVKEKDLNNEIELVDYNSSAEEGMYNDLEFGRIDAILAQDVAATSNIKELKLDLKIIDPSLISDPVSFAFNKDENGEKWKTIVDDFLTEVHDDGTIAEICEKWVGRDLSKKNLNE